MMNDKNIDSIDIDIVDNQHYATNIAINLSNPNHFLKNESLWV